MQVYSLETMRKTWFSRSKILWDFTIQCDTKIGARQPHIVVIDTTKKEVKMVDVTIPRDARVNERKVEKIKVLKDEIARM